MRQRLLSLSAALALSLGAVGSASAGMLQDNLDVSIQTYGICEFSVSKHIEVIGLYGLQGQFDNATAGELMLRCNPNITYTVEPGDGQYFGLATDHADKRAAFGDSWNAYLPYTLHKAGGTLPWGTGGDAIMGYGNGDWEFHPVGIKVYDMYKVPGDTYTDQVVVTLTYL